MKMSEGVEWAAHACAVLAALPKDGALKAEAIAAYHDLPPAYLAKHMQALARAGVVSSSRGAKGGYWLARDAANVTLWDIAVAIEGAGPVFRCSEIRQRGPCAARREACKRPCSIAHAFHNAEAAMRDHLRAVSLETICINVAAGYKRADAERFGAWLGENLLTRPAG